MKGVQLFCFVFEEDGIYLEQYKLTCVIIWQDIQFQFYIYQLLKYILENVFQFLCRVYFCWGIQQCWFLRQVVVYYVEGRVFVCFKVGEFDWGRQSFYKLIGSMFCRFVYNFFQFFGEVVCEIGGMKSDEFISWYFQGCLVKIENWSFKDDLIGGVLYGLEILQV